MAFALGMILAALGVVSTPASAAREATDRMADANRDTMTAREMARSRLRSLTKERASVSKQINDIGRKIGQLQNPTPQQISDLGLQRDKLMTQLRKIDQKIAMEKAQLGEYHDKLGYNEDAVAKRKEDDGQLKPYEKAALVVGAVALAGGAAAAIGAVASVKAPSGPPGGALAAAAMLRSPSSTTPSYTPPVRSYWDEAPPPRSSLSLTVSPVTSGTSTNLLTSTTLQPRTLPPLPVHRSHMTHMEIADINE